MSRRGSRRAQRASTSGAAHDEEGDRPQPMGIDAQLMPENLHPFLNFSRRLPEYNVYCQKFQSLRNKTFEPPRTVDWAPLDAAGVGNDIRPIIRQRFFTNGGHHDYEDWENFFSLTEPIFRELCLEFHSTYQMNEYVTDADDNSLMHFRLGGRSRRMSMIQLARCLNIYTEEELNSPYFRSYLQSGERIDIDFYPRNIWHEFSDTEYVNGGNSFKDLRQMELRVIHRFLAYTICQRREGCDKVSQYDLYYLRKFSNEQNVCIPFSVAWFLKHNASGLKESSPISGGHIITKMARYYEVEFDGLTRVPDRHRTVGALHFVGAGAIVPHNNTYIAVQAEGEQPPQQQQRRQRRRLQPPPQQQPQQQQPQQQQQFPGGFHQASTSGTQPGIPEIIDMLGSMQLQNNYEYRVQHYQSAWYEHNLSRLSEVMPNYRTTRNLHPPLWTPQGPNHDPPAYDQDTAMEEVQEWYRRQREQGDN